MGRAVRAHRIEGSITEERIVRAMKLVVELMPEHGLVLMPYFNRLERELNALRMRDDPMKRIHRFMEAYTIDGTVKAIR